MVSPCKINSSIFVRDLSSYGIIGLVSIGFILYVSYMIKFLRNKRWSNGSILIYVSNAFLFLNLISPIVFLIRPTSPVDSICLSQNLSIQIFPFCLLLCYNVYFVEQWLKISSDYSSRKSCLISISSILIAILAILIETAILLIWFYNQHHYRDVEATCSSSCSRPLFLCSLSFNFFLLFLYSFQSSLRYHFYNDRKDSFALLTSVSASIVTITWICFYLFLPFRTSWAIYMNNQSILAYGTIFFVYSFLGPFLFEEFFYPSSSTHIIQDFKKPIKAHKMTFQSLSLTKEQQRAFMAAYIKRNLTASCENLTSINILSPLEKSRSNGEQLIRTCHSTLSVDSLCPTMDISFSHGQTGALSLRENSCSPTTTTLTTTTTTTTNSSDSTTMSSQCFLLNNSSLNTKLTK